MHDDIKDEIRHRQNEAIEETMQADLSDEQLQQLAEGASSWGANCNKGGGCT
jgi:hypothetical protein